MPPLPYPHRVVFLPTAFGTTGDPNLREMAARLLAAIIADRLVRHSTIVVGDFEEERFVDESGAILDVTHPAVAEGTEWYFRAARCHQILWFSFDIASADEVVLHCLTATGSQESWHQNVNHFAIDGSVPAGLSQALDGVLAQWLATSRLAPLAPLAPFSLTDLLSAARALVSARNQVTSSVASTAEQSDAAIKSVLNVSLSPALVVACLRVIATLGPMASRLAEAAILHVDEHHIVARRNRYVSELAVQRHSPADILQITAEAPMYSRARLSLYGDAFGIDEYGLKRGLYHQGVAVTLAPANAFACHNYSVLLAEVGRREESYRWADRATVANPRFAIAQLDCVRRLRLLGRPGQALAEAKYRCGELVESSASDLEMQGHAYLLLAFVHFDIGRINEAIDLADLALERAATDPNIARSFGWAQKRVAFWKSDPGLLARCYAWDGFYRGDYGRAVAGMYKSRVSDPDDAAMLIQSLIAIGREDEASLAFEQFLGNRGHDLLSDGKARLAGAKAMILAGDLAGAMQQIQIVQLRRPASRFEAEINRLLRLGACRSPSEWERVVQLHSDAGANDLARRAARDLADFVPRMDTPIIEKALGQRIRWSVSPQWIIDFVDQVPNAGDCSALLRRLRQPSEWTLRAADSLAQEWWQVLVPPAKSRDSHAAGAVVALGISLANYLSLCCGPATPVAGAYRHIAVEALQLCRRSRYSIDTKAIRALLEFIEKCSATQEWLLDTWLLRIERTFDLEAEHGTTIDSLTIGLPTVRRLLRGDERIGWEFRLALDLAGDPTQYEAAATLFERSSRAIEGGSVFAAWSIAAANAAPSATYLDVHWSAAAANPTMEWRPWLQVAMGLFDLGRGAQGLEPAYRAIALLRSAPTTANSSEAAKAKGLAQLEASWEAANIEIPFDRDEAIALGNEMLERGEIDRSLASLRWALALASDDQSLVQSLAQSIAIAYCRAGRGASALRTIGYDRTDAASHVAMILLECSRTAEAFPIIRFASRRFRTAEAWIRFAHVAEAVGHSHACATACRNAIALGARSDIGLLAIYCHALARIGDFTACEMETRRLLGLVQTKEQTTVAQLCMARALAGQERFDEAKTFLHTAQSSAPATLARDIAEISDSIASQTPVQAVMSQELTPARVAFSKLEQSEFAELALAVGSADWAVLRAALAGMSYRGDDGQTIVPAKALDVAVNTLARTEGATNLDAALVRIGALRLREDAFIQIDAPPPLGVAMTSDEFDERYAQRTRETRAKT